MTTKFDVRLRVDAELIAPILKHVGDKCVLLDLKQVNEPTARETFAAKVYASAGNAPMKPPRYAHGKRNKGITGKELALKILGQEPLRPWSWKSIGEEFVKNQFAHNSASPILMELKRERKVLALGEGMYCLPGTVVKMGATSNI